MNKHLDQVPRRKLFQMTNGKEHRLCTKGTPPTAAETFNDNALGTLNSRYPNSRLEGET